MLSRLSARWYLWPVAFTIYNLISFPADAQTWTGAISQYWDTAGNWSTNAVPPVTGTPQIDKGTVVFRSPAVTIRSLTVGRVSGNIASLTLEQGTALSLAGASTLNVGTTSGTGTITIDGATLNVAGRTNIGSGNGGSGRIVIKNGGTLFSDHTNATYLGTSSPAGSGEVLIEGTNSQWLTTARIEVGDTGTGTITVRNGGLLKVYGDDPNHLGLGFADSVNAHGEMLVDGGTVISMPGISVGIDGYGRVEIRNGGKLETGWGWGNYDLGGLIGYQPSATGEVIVDGPGSSWVSSKHIVVGVLGRGALTISNGAQVTAQELGIIGHSPSPNTSGTVLITGAGSSWTVQALDMAPRTQTLALLTVSDGGTLKTTSADGIRVGNLGDAEINVGAAPGQPAAAPGHLDAPAILLVQAEHSRLNFNHTDDSGNYAFRSVLTGSGQVSVLAGTTVFSEDSPAFGGTISVTGGRLLTNSRIAGTFTVGPEGTLGGGGVFDGDVSNAGILAPGALNPVGSYATMTIRGNYVSNDGLLVLNTSMGADASPTDRLVVEGDVVTGTGATGVRVTNTAASQLGAPTTGDGIQIIVVSGASPGDAFYKRGRIAAGAYEYDLFQGGASGPNDGNWYLRSSYKDDGGGGSGGGGGGGGGGSGGGGDSGDGGGSAGGKDVPNNRLRIEVPVYSAAPALANRLGLAFLGTYRERIGDRFVPAPPPEYEERVVSAAGKTAMARGPIPSADGNRNYFPGAWARIFGETGAVGHGGGTTTERLAKFAKNGPSFDYQTAGFQAGLDTYRSLQADGSQYAAGLYAGAGRIDSDIRAAKEGYAGSMALDGYTLGAYATRTGPSGWYIDAVIQGTLYDDVEGTSILGERMKTDGWGVAASLESGYPIALGHGLIFEPQAQIVYLHTALDDGSDSFGRVRFGDTDTLYGRIGARLKTDWTPSGGTTVTAWAYANLWSAFNQDATTTFTNLSGNYPTPIATALGSTYAQIGAGLSGQLAGRIGVFASGNYDVSVDGGRGHGFGGRLGIKMAW